MRRAEAEGGSLGMGPGQEHVLYVILFLNLFRPSKEAGWLIHPSKLTSTNNLGSRHVCRLVVFLEELLA